MDILIFYFAVVAVFLFLAMIAEQDKEGKKDWKQCLIVTICGMVILRCFPMLLELIA